MCGSHTKGITKCINEKPIHICGLVLFEWLVSIYIPYHAKHFNGHEAYEQAGASEAKKND